VSAGALDDDFLLDRIDSISAYPLTARMYRHTSPGRDPLSGAGAARFGGRWNPPGVATIYLAKPKDATFAELRNLATKAAISVTDLIDRGRTLHSIDVTGLPVLDLTAPDNLRALGVTLEDLADDDRSLSQAIGQAAYHLDRFSGILAPSARDSTGQVLAAFELRADLAHLSFVTTRDITSGDLTGPP